jgi:hypothetical protein
MSASRVAARSGAVIGITSGLKSSSYWCLTKTLLLLRKDNPTGTS